MGKFLEGLGGFLGESHSPINSIIFASGHKSFGKIDISSLMFTHYTNWGDRVVVNMQNVT